MKQTLWSHCADQSTEAQSLETGSRLRGLHGTETLQLVALPTSVQPKSSGADDFHPQSLGGSDIITVMASVLQAEHRGSQSAWSRETGTGLGTGVGAGEGDSGEGAGRFRVGSPSEVFPGFGLISETSWR